MHRVSDTQARERTRRMPPRPRSGAGTRIARRAGDAGRWSLAAWAVLAVLVSGAAKAAAPVGRGSDASADGRVVELRGGSARLVELYTSEGCSSCPRAEAYLAGLIDSPGLWRDVVPVAFHVDLWDHLGWADRLASTRHTTRLEDYARRWNAERIYTPEFVVDGAEWRGYFDGLPVETLARPRRARVNDSRARPNDASRPDDSRTRPDDEREDVEDASRPHSRDDAGRGVTLRVRLARASADVTVRGAFDGAPHVEAIVLGFGIRQYVARGENAGRELEHDFAVVGMAEARAVREGDAWRAVLPVRAVKDVRWKRLALVACARDEPLGPPRAVAAGWIEPDDVELVWSEGGAVDRVERSDEEWRRILTDEQYRILRQQGTERAFTGAYWDHHEDGVYVCAGCGQPLFDSTTKFESGSGWPSFYRPVDAKRVEEQRDLRFGMVRTEVHCSRCGGHLGHVFDDGPRPTGLRYCINSASLRFVPRESPEAKAAREAKRDDDSR